MTETYSKNPENGETLENRITALTEAIKIWPDRPIELENLYLKNGALKATAPYGGLAPIVEAHGRLRRFVGQFRDQTDKGAKTFAPDIMERAEKSLQILRSTAEGGDLSTADKKAADLIANILLRRAQELKSKKMLDEKTVNAFNFSYHEIRRLIDDGQLGGARPANLEDKFPLAWTMDKVKNLEKIIDDAVARKMAEDAETKRENERLRTQVRIQKHK